MGLTPLNTISKIGEQNQANVKIKNRIKLTNHNCNGMELVQVTFKQLTTLNFQTN